MLFNILYILFPCLYTIVQCGTIYSKGNPLQNQFNRFVEVQQEICSTFACKFNGTCVVTFKSTTAEPICQCSRDCYKGLNCEIDKCKVDKDKHPVGFVFMFIFFVTSLSYLVVCVRFVFFYAKKIHLKITLFNGRNGFFRNNESSPVRRTDTYTDQPSSGQSFQSNGSKSCPNKRIETQFMSPLNLDHLEDNPPQGMQNTRVETDETTDLSVPYDDSRAKRKILINKPIRSTNKYGFKEVVYGGSYSDSSSVCSLEQTQEIDPVDEIILNRLKPKERLQY